MSQAGRALAYAFETGALAPQRAFFLRAEPSPFRDSDAEQCIVFPAGKKLRAIMPPINRLKNIVKTKGLKLDFFGLGEGMKCHY